MYRGGYIYRWLLGKKSASLGYSGSGRSSHTASACLWLVSLKVNFGSGLNGTNGDVLEGGGFCSARAAASNRIMKISASIATTL